MRFLFGLFILLSGSLAKAAELPKNVELILACYADCERGIVRKVNDQWLTLREPVKTFTIRVTKSAHDFSIYASGYEVAGAGVAVNIKLIYQGTIADDGVLSGDAAGSFHNSGELDFTDLSSKCRFTLRPETGKDVLFASCENSSDLDFSGLVVLTEKLEYP